MEDSLGNAVSALSKVPKTPGSNTSESRTQKFQECCNCGRKHEFYKRELCPAFGKLCHKCKNPTILPVSVVARKNGGDMKLVDESNSEVEDSEAGVPSEHSGRLAVCYTPTGVRKPCSNPGRYRNTVPRPTSECVQEGYRGYQP